MTQDNALPSAPTTAVGLGQPPAAGTPPDPAPETVLVVDDDPAIRLYLTALLTRWGLRVESVDNGEAALARLASGDIDLCLVDWIMPGMDGTEMLRRVRLDEGPVRVYMIMVTGRGGAEHIADGLAAGADDYVSKPVAPKELRHRVEAGLRLVRANKALADRNRVLEETNASLDAAGTRMRQDLEAARAIVAALLPKPAGTVGGMRYATLWRPFNHVGGDLIGVRPLNSRQTALYCIDVVGHGVTAALHATQVHQAITLAVIGHEQDVGRVARDPASIVADLNRHFLDRSDGSLNVAMTYGVFDAEDGTVALCVAGNPVPLLRGRDGDVRPAGRPGFPVGMLPMATYETEVVPISPGETLVIHTDGLSDHLGGGDGVVAVLGQPVADTGLPLPDPIMQGIRARCETVADDQHDDLSALLLTPC